MPLDALFFPDDHHLFAADDHAAAHHIDAAAWPLQHVGTLRPMKTALNGGGGGAGADPITEPGRSLMEIESIGLPEKAKLDDLSEACKFDQFTSVFGDASDAGATRSAKALGGAIEKVAKCNENASDVVLSNMFGQKLNPTQGGMGVTMTKTHDIPVGSLAKKSIKSAQDSCEDFSTFLLRRFEQPGTAPKCPAADDAAKPGEVPGTKFTSKDATHVMKSYGLCLDSIGETTALHGCEMGNLQNIGSREAADLCKVVEGPIPPGIVCAIM